ncbi:MAG: Holliday junction branch migration protein RuvA [Frankiaceae bacterium]
MIAGVSGRVSALALDSAVVDVGGVGLLVHCTPATLARLRVGEPAQLATSLVVREDALTLYGFADAEERAVFELLQSASGVGPRLAQAVLAVHAPAAVRRAIASDDLGALTQVPGIGRKGAQRIVLELKDKVGALPPAPGVPQPAGAAARPWGEQVRAALVGLGYSQREADDAVARVAPELEGTGATAESPDVAAVLRSALRTLTRA